MKEIIKHKYSYLLFFLLLVSCFASAYGQERTITLNPVSYTHLDVYKRQMPGHVPLIRIATRKRIELASLAQPE